MASLDEDDPIERFIITTNYFWDLYVGKVFDCASQARILEAFKQLPEFKEFAAYEEKISQMSGHKELQSVVTATLDLFKSMVRRAIIKGGFVSRKE